MKFNTSILPLFSLIFLVSGCNGLRDVTDDTASSAEKCDSSDAPFGGGSGTASKPYLICSVTQLQQVRTNLTKNFKLMADLDLNAVSFNPMGTMATGFSGVFDGNSHTISNWTYAAANLGDAAGYPGPIENDFCGDGGCTIPHDPNTVHPDYAAGFFRTLENAAVIKNLNLTGVSLQGRFNTGGLVGYMKSGSTIQDCNVTTSGLVADVQTAMTGIIIGYNDHPTGSTSGRTAGVVGEAEINTTITRTSFSGLVRGAMIVGGIVGTTLGTVSNVHSSGGLVCRDGNCGGIAGNLGAAAAGGPNIPAAGGGGTLTGSDSTMTMVGVNNGGVMGGLVGSTNSTTVVINTSHYSGTLSGTFALGGVIGAMNGGTISKCYATGSISGGAAVAGFVGWMYGGASISDSYANTAVTFSSDQVYIAGGGAGFAGLLANMGGSGTINRVYAAGTVSTSNGALVNFGDLASNIDATAVVTNSFADSGVSTHGLISTAAGGSTLTGSSSQTTANMKAAATYAGWDFTNVWQITEGVSYPTLR